MSKADDEDDDESSNGSLLDLLRASCESSTKIDEGAVTSLYSSLERSFRMFYLKQQMLGNLKERKEDYFV